MRLDAPKRGPRLYIAVILIWSLTPDNHAIANNEASAIHVGMSYEAAVMQIETAGGKFGLYNPSYVLQDDDDPEINHEVRIFLFPGRKDIRLVVTGPIGERPTHVKRIEIGQMRSPLIGKSYFVAERETLSIDFEEDLGPDVRILRGLIAAGIAGGVYLTIRRIRRRRSARRLADR